MDLEKLLQYGWPTLALAVVGLFIWKRGWPFLEKQLEDAQAKTQSNTEEFLLALSRRDMQQVKHDAELIARLDLIISVLRSSSLVLKRPRPKYIRPLDPPPGAR